MTNSTGAHGAHSIEVWYGWVVLFASLIIHTIGLGAPTVLFVALKPIAADFDWPRAGPSLAYSLLMVGSGVGGIAMGLWMDRRGVMRPVMFGATMIVIGALVASQAESRMSFYLANGLLIGLLGKSAMIAPLIANATQWFDRRRGLAVAIIASGQGLAGALWPPVVQHFNDSVGWRGTYGYFAIFALLTMLPLALLLKRPPPEPAASSSQERMRHAGRVLGLHRQAVQGLMWVAVVGCCGAMSMPIVHLVSHATDLGHPETRAAELLSILFAAAFVSRIAFGVLSDRIGALPTVLIGSSCQAAMLLVFAFVESLQGLYVSAALFGLGFAGIMPCYALVIRLFFPANQAGWRIASQYMFASVGMALGGWLGGAMYDLTGTYTDAFLIGFALNIVNLVLMATLALRHRRVILSPQPA
jgi:predicted MFS family arabinose efflux permease